MKSTKGLLIEIIEDSRIGRRSPLSGSEWSNRNHFGNVLQAVVAAALSGAGRRLPGLGVRI